MFLPQTKLEACVQAQPHRPASQDSCDPAVSRPVHPCLRRRCVDICHVENVEHWLDRVVTLFLETKCSPKTQIQSGHVRQSNGIGRQDRDRLSGLCQRNGITSDRYGLSCRKSLIEKGRGTHI